MKNFCLFYKTHSTNPSRPKMRHLLVVWSFGRLVQDFWHNIASNNNWSNKSVASSRQVPNTPARRSEDAPARDFAWSRLRNTLCSGMRDQFCVDPSRFGAKILKTDWDPCKDMVAKIEPRLANLMGAKWSIPTLVEVMFFQKSRTKRPNDQMTQWPMKHSQNSMKFWSNRNLITKCWLAITSVMI